MNWKQLINKVAEASRVTFQRLRVDHPGEDFYVYALYTDSSAMTIVPAANSVQSFEDSVPESSKSDKNCYNYYKWSTAEWRYEACDDDEFTEICTLLREDSGRSKDFAAFEKNTHSCMIEALKILVDEGFFGTGPDRDKIVVFITISDDNRAAVLEKGAAKILNSKIAYELFTDR